MSAEIDRLSRSGRAGIGVSFEFFPPKTEEMDAQLWDAVTRLAPLAPNFVSVTYGAGGSTRERTHATVARIVRETPLKPATANAANAAVRQQSPPARTIRRPDAALTRAYPAMPAAQGPQASEDRW